VSELPPLLCVVGPTGSGKSDLAIRLAEELDGEIVNCDSVQLYRYMDIGTAKTPLEERRGIPHHLIDILDPDEHFTAGDYGRAARKVVREIAGRGRLPIVAGGTGFYLRALLHGLMEAPKRDANLRERLARRKPGSLHRLLAKFDKEAARRIHPNDTPKLIRAIEVCLTARRPITDLFRENEAKPLEGFRIAKVGLSPDRTLLAKRIDERCERMFKGGLIEEICRILELGFSPTAKALMSIGYREGVQVLQSEMSVVEALTRTQTATRQYAKRQRTWFRREPGIFWLHGFGFVKKAAEDVVHHLKVDINFI
jgi:tRNA dimethylallyltransferase